MGRIDSLFFSIIDMIPFIRVRYLNNYLYNNLLYKYKFTQTKINIDTKIKIIER